MSGVMIDAALRLKPASLFQLRQPRLGSPSIRLEKTEPPESADMVRIEAKGRFECGNRAGIVPNRQTFGHEPIRRRGLRCCASEPSEHEKYPCCVGEVTSVGAGSCCRACTLVKHEVARKVARVLLTQCWTWI